MLAVVDLDPPVVDLDGQAEPECGGGVAGPGERARDDADDRAEEGPKGGGLSRSLVGQGGVGPAEQDAGGVGGRLAVAEQDQHRVGSAPSGERRPDQDAPALVAGDDGVGGQMLDAVELDRREAQVTAATPARAGTTP